LILAVDQFELFLSGYLLKPNVRELAEMTTISSKFYVSKPCPEHDCGNPLQKKADLLEQALSVRLQRGWY